MPLFVKFASISNVPAPEIVPAFVRAPTALNVPAFAISPELDKVEFIVIVLPELLVNFLPELIVKPFWVIVPALVNVPFTTNVPVPASVPLFVKVVFTVVVALDVSVLPLAIVNTFCEIFFAVEKESFIFVVPLPLIDEPNASVPDKFNIPALDTPLLIFKLLADILTVPELITMAD